MKNYNLVNSRRLCFKQLEIVLATRYKYIIELYVFSTQTYNNVQIYSAQVRRK